MAVTCAKRLVADTLKTVARMRSTDATDKPLVRTDSAFYGHPTISAALTGGADVSVTVRLAPDIKRAIAAIDQDEWTTIKYPQAIWDEDSRTWISRAEVAEVSFTAFTAQRKAHHVPGRLVVRRIPDVTADKNVHADLKDSALAHMPSGVFAANAAWLVLAVIAFNLTRAAATPTGQPAPAKATTGTLRRKLIYPTEHGMLAISCRLRERRRSIRAVTNVLTSFERCGHVGLHA